MPKIEISSKKGLVQKSGEGIVIKNGDITRDVSAHEANVTLTQGGIYTMGSGGAKTLTFPLPADVAGQQFIVRATTAQAHILTASQAAADFCGRVKPGSSATETLVQNGGKLTLQALIGASVCMVSDGKQYLVTAFSGSHTMGGFPRD